MSSSTGLLPQLHSPTGLLPQLHSPTARPPATIKAPPPALKHNTSGELFRQKLLYLEQDLRINSVDALSLNPSLRSSPLSSIISVVNFLSSYRLSPRDSSRIFQMHPNLLTADPAADLLPILDFLHRDVGIPFHDLRKCLVRCPRLLLSSVPHQLQPTLFFLRRLGFTGAHRIKPQTTLLLVYDVERTYVPKLDFIQSLGFTYKEAVALVVRAPRILTFSIENNLRPKAEFLIGEMGRDVKELKKFPQFFNCSLEGKIMPRHRALVENGLEMGLGEMLKISDGEFTVRLLDMRLEAAEEPAHYQGSIVSGRM